MARRWSGTRKSRAVLGRTFEESRGPLSPPGAAGEDARSRTSASVVAPCFPSLPRLVPRGTENGPFLPVGSFSCILESAVSAV